MSLRPSRSTFTSDFPILKLVRSRRLPPPPPPSPGLRRCAAFGLAIGRSAFFIFGAPDASEGRVARPSTCGPELHSLDVEHTCLIPDACQRDTNSRGSFQGFPMALSLIASALHIPLDRVWSCDVSHCFGDTFLAYR